LKNCNENVFSFSQIIEKANVFNNIEGESLKQKNEIEKVGLMEKKVII